MYLSKNPEIIQTTNSPAGPLWIWVKTLNDRIRNLPEVQNE